MSDYESRREDARVEAAMERAGSECLSDDPYCARSSRSYGTYERYKGELCGACIDALEEDNDG